MHASPETNIDHMITSSQQVADYILVIANSLMRTFLMQGTGNKRSNTWKLYKIKNWVFLTTAYIPIQIASHVISVVIVRRYPGTHSDKNRLKFCSFA